MGKFSLIWFREIMKRAISLDAFRGFAIIMMEHSGTIAGEYLKDWIMNRTHSDQMESFNSHRTIWILAASITLLVVNLYGLYTRCLVLNLFSTVALLITLWYLLKTQEDDGRCWKNLFVAGAYLLMLGLFFEAFEGGIRKDYSTYSYYFVTSGLAFFTLLAFTIMGDVYHLEKWLKPLIQAGKNPMIAYVAINMVVMPLINLLGLTEYLDFFNANAWLGFLRGIIITSIAVSLAMICSRFKLYWRT